MGNTITGSGQVSLGDIYDEFTDTHSGAEEIQLTDYYDKGNAPASGEIQLAADFYGTSDVATVTGGTPSYNGSYTVRTFTSTANLVVADGDVPMEILVVGGGGGGPDVGGNYGDFLGGGGGGGGILYKAAHTVTAGTYSAAIGAGDNDTTFVSVTSTKGGLSGYGGGAGGAGANGGGGSGYTSGGSPGAGTAPSATGWTGYGGYPGGEGKNLTSLGSHSGGGGGGAAAGGAPGHISGVNGGYGGVGRQVDIDGNNYYWCGGGGGCGYVGNAGAGGSGGGGGGCFVAETKIQTINKTAYIEDVQIGDIVKSFDLQNNTLQNAEVINTFIHPNERILVINGIIRTTPNHPFYSSGHWVAAEELSVGDKILNVDGTEHSVSTIELLDETETVYNFEVEGTHNYFADNYLVHNKSGDAGGGANGAGGTGGISNGSAGGGGNGGNAGENTGGGGGGGSWTGNEIISGNGGSGIVIVSYLTSLAN